jgi:acetyltransferase-like isoleucine patch superfamily enzyme
VGYLTIDPNADIGHGPQYFTDREVELDCRGPLHISPLSHWGIGVKVVTASHEPGNMSIVKYLPVTVEAGAWICSYAILYNCRIGENAIVAIGAVVRSRNVPDGTMVEGNPARIIARLVNDKWEYIDYQIPLEAKK